ncbi:hypothetical protein F0562_012651 [Nyssa sinensis]|uniref:RNase H type-1 domain-containing protein n=1 Tax=Nyssa sinensis TaxID=561372 RepID=A0A5J4ZTF4_9ASTE|nr:hypothetical protein F0562_012651 [Nyssa sinensis]
MRATRSKQALEILQQEYQGDLKARIIKLQNLFEDFETIKMKENETLNDFSTRYSELVNQMKTFGEDISDARIFEKILISLSEKFDAIVAVVEETKDISKLSMQELMGSLKSYEQRLSRRSKKSLESAFQSKLNFSSRNAEKKSSTQEQSKGELSKDGRQGKGRGRNWRGRGRYSSERKFNEEESSQRCNICKRSSHVEKDCWFRGKPQCHNCKRFGYVQKDFRIKTNQQASFMEEKEVYFKDDCCIIYDERRSRQIVAKLKIEKNRSFPLTFKYMCDVALKLKISPLTAGRLSQSDGSEYMAALAEGDSNVSGAAAGVGMVVRNSVVEFIANFSKFRSLVGSSQIMEAYAILDGLRLCYSKFLVDLSNAGANVSLDLEAIATDIWQSQLLVGAVHFCHVKRDGSRVAHELAKRCSSVESFVVWFEDSLLLL